MNDDNTYPLDEPMIRLIEDIQRRANSQIEGALLLFLRQHELPGQWAISANGKEVQRLDVPVTR